MKPFTRPVDSLRTPFKETGDNMSPSEVRCVFYFYFSVSVIV